jgi:hypothetical protein
MVGIAQNDLRAQRIEVIGMQGLDRSLRAHWHENRRFYHTMRELQAPQAGFGFGIGLQ